MRNRAVKVFTASFYLIILLILSSETLIAQHKIIKIDNDYAPNEPSIIFNPINPDVWLIGTNLRSIYRSENNGDSWNRTGMVSTYGVWGDPVLISDTAGHFYYFHLSNPSSGNWIDRIVCQKSIDQGQTWTSGTYFGLNGTKAQDKHWAIVNSTNNHIYVTWTQFDDYGSANPNDRSNIMFSKSTDGAETWSPAQRISEVDGDCIDEDDTTEGAVPCIGPNGEIYVSWAGPAGLVFDRSLDGGETWLENDIFVNEFPGGWDYTIPGIYRCNGLPITACDTSQGPNRGTIYINWTDQRNGVDDTDVWLAKSTDGGDSWTDAIRVNDDPPGKHQFLTWMTIDQTNGYLYFVFYDRRMREGTATDVFMARSTDGGETFTNFKVSESPFIPDVNVFFGDYSNVVAHDNIIRSTWCSFEADSMTLWAAEIDPDSILTTSQQVIFEQDIVQNYPNPFSDNIYFSFKLHKVSVINLKLFDQSGNLVKTLISEKQMGYGKYIESFNTKDLNIQPGVYFFEFEIDGEKTTTRSVLVE
jgi:hypothetical protein